MRRRVIRRLAEEGGFGTLKSQERGVFAEMVDDIDYDTPQSSSSGDTTQL